MRAPKKPLSLSALLLADVSDKKKPRAASARTRPHDWEALYARVLAESTTVLDGPLIIDWDERYVHAIERALTGRKPDELLKMLDDRRYLHPELLPALADVIRAQHDPGREARSLRPGQDAVIRGVYDKMGEHVTLDWFAKPLVAVSVAQVKASLSRTESKRK